MGGSRSSGKGKKGMPREHKCQFCKKTYAMAWARDNHEKHCAQNPNRGKLYG